MALGSVVLVPLARPASAGPLMHVAAGIAAHDDGVVLPVSVIPPKAPCERRGAAADVVLAAESIARQFGVDAHGLVVESSDVPSGIHTLVASQGATLVVMGWRGAGSRGNVFGKLVDEVIGRSRVPLAILRPARGISGDVVLAVADDHLRAEGERGVELAATLARRLRPAPPGGLTLIRAGDGRGLAGFAERFRAEVDRIHHDPRRLADAVAAASRAGDLVVAPVAPTIRGLRDASVHLAYAAPEASLLVAIDVGPVGSRRLDGALESAATGPVIEHTEPRPYRVVVTVSTPPGQTIRRATLARTLEEVGDVGDLDVWWDAAPERQHLQAPVHLVADSASAAIGEVMVTLHETPVLTGCDLRYDVAPDDELLIVDELLTFGGVLEDEP